MIKFIEKPNLPDGAVKALICGTNDKDILSFFEKRGIEVLKNAPNELVDVSVSSHADMASIHLGADRIIIDKGQKELEKELESRGLNVIGSSVNISGSYPTDSALNFTMLGEYVIGRFASADAELLLNTSELTKVNTNQGYCKCSCLIVRENALITDDESVFINASKAGIDVLLVSKGDVSLEGYSYGFIGGASGKISSDEVLFFGDISKHRDYAEILSFLNKYDCNYVCSDGNCLRDIGGIIPLTEYVEKNY